MGPLKGIKILEIGGLGPSPFCAMMLADMGADIIHVVRKGEQPLLEQKYDVLNRGRRSVGIDLKNPKGVEAVLKLVEHADGLQEGFRPGVMEKMGLGPEVCLKRNPKLVYGRMTGWGQEGPLSQAAGHDINYISLAGALHAIGLPGEKPVVPLNLVGDFGGGGMLLAFGMVCAILEAQKSGKGQVLDAAIIDGVLIQMGIFYALHAGGLWSEHGTNMVDGGSHFYNIYETSDGKWISIGSMESKFYQLLLELAEIDDPEFDNQMEMSKWPELKTKFEAIFKTKTRDEWCKIMEGTDVCFAPVLSFDDAIKHPHNIARNTFVELGGIPHPVPAPRFSRTIPEIQCPAPELGADTESALADWGFNSDEIDTLKAEEAI